ncbi:MAG: T9SS type A sorting domain-containing protein, partial [Bacteroidetes bacterium]|nr:T9SS type A sorting domain-containing protein [Bacteroidota bacterium]
FQLDSESPQTYNWTGNLTPGNSQNISIGTIGLSEGNHTLLIHTTNPNGTIDINTTNDTILFNFTSVNGQAYNITVVPDNYGEEVSWEITDYSGMVIAAEDELTSNEANNAELCLLSDSCYTFTIYDEYDDGICCDYGNGYFSINSQVFDGAYGEEMSIDLCELSNLTEIITTNNLVYPNPTEGMIWIETTENTIQNISVYNYLGEVVKSIRSYSSNQAVDLSSLKNGIYLLEMKNTNNQSIVQKVIIHK